MTCSPAIVARAVSARHWRFLTSIPRSLAIRSIAKNPRLCGVNWYSIPGLPKPTISFTHHSMSKCATSSCGDGTSPIPAGQSPATTQTLFLVFLLGLLSLLSGLGLTLGIALAFLTLSFLLTLLNNFGFSRSRRRIRNRFRSRNHFFLHSRDVRDHLIFFCEELQLRVMRKIFHPNFHAKHEVTDIDLDIFRNVGWKTLNLNLARQLLKNATLRLHA